MIIRQKKLFYRNHRLNDELVKWQKKTAICDLMKNVLPLNFVNRFVWTDILHKSLNQSGGQIH